MVGACRRQRGVKNQSFTLCTVGTGLIDVGEICILSNMNEIAKS